MLKKFYKPALYRPSKNTIVLSSFPRTGATLLRFIVSTLLTRKLPDFDTIKYDFPDIYEGKPRRNPVIVKSHQPPKYKNRLIVLVRNPIEVYESYFHYKVIRHGYMGGKLSVDAFMNLAKDGKLDRYGTYLSHLKIIEVLLNRSDVLVINYTDLIRNKQSIIEQLASFISLDYDETSVQLAIRASEKSRMRKMAEERVIDLEKSFVRELKSTSFTESLSSDNMAYIKNCTELYERITSKIYR
jgi:hypothetical protein